MTKTMTMWAVLFAVSCGNQAPSTGAAATAATASPTAIASSAATASATASASPTATAEPEDNDPLPTKKYDCGAKGQKPCPMQGWMKRVMGPASSSGDGPKLAEALVYAAKKPPAGYTAWAAMANEGAAKAKAGDIEGAKASCKKCHEKYKQDYKATMRDKPW